MTHKEREFYTAGELAQRLRINIMTVYRNIKSGRLVAYKIGKEFRIKTGDFESFLESKKYSYKLNNDSKTN